MVSNVLDIDADELAEELVRLAQRHGQDPDYIAWRAELPDDWPF